VLSCSDHMLKPSTMLSSSIAAHLWVGNLYSNKVVFAYILTGLPLSVQVGQGGSVTLPPPPRSSNLPVSAEATPI